MFGHHLHSTGEPMADRLAAAAAGIAADYDFKLTAAQVFFTGPRGAKAVLTSADEKPLRAYLARTHTALLVHGAYIDVYWSERANVAARAATNIRRELAMCARVGARGLVVHLPQNTLARALSGLPATLAPVPKAVLYMENPGNGHPSDGPNPRGFETPAKLGALLAAAKAELSAEAYGQLGLCIDTAHLWSSGVDVRSRAAARAWLRDFETMRRAARLPPARLAFHLNDSLNPRGSGNDQHAPLREGQIWGALADGANDDGADDHAGDDDNDRAGYMEFIAYAVEHGIPAVFERSPKFTLDADYLSLIGAL